MSISNLFQKWSGINETSKILIVVDDIQKNIADSIKDEKIYEVQIEYFIKSDDLFSLLKSMKSSDLPIECRKMVELGQGLSKMEPTGLIGVD